MERGVHVCNIIYKFKCADFKKIYIGETAWPYTTRLTLSAVGITHLKPQPNDRNMPTQHIATLLGITCCVRLATLLRHVATCWVLLLLLLLAQIWPFFKLEPTTPHSTHQNIVAKRTQHVAPNNVGISCVGILRSFGWGFKDTGHKLVESKVAVIARNKTTSVREFVTVHGKTYFNAICYTVEKLKDLIIR